MEYRAEEQQCEYYQSGNEVDDEQRERSDGAKGGDEEGDGVECEVEQQVPGDQWPGKHLANHNSLGDITERQQDDGVDDRNGDHMHESNGKKNGAEEVCYGCEEDDQDENRIHDNGNDVEVGGGLKPGDIAIDDDKVQQRL